MNRARRFFPLLAMLLAGAPIFAETKTNTAPPPLPPLKSPVDTFRELLMLAPAERTQALAARPAGKREGLLEKLRAYQALNSDEREARLLATEFRWWLLQLMRVPATNRTNELTQVPARLRKLVEDRLQVWDLLPRDLQQAQLDNEDLAQRFTRLEGSTSQQRTQILQNLSPQLQAGLTHWAAMSTEERRRTCEQFDHYFELTAREQSRVLSKLSETEHEQMDLTLQSFARLPREQRIICLRSFEKFTGMSVADRQQFLKNAERWEKMSPAERETWRRLVKHVPDFPPLPPGVGSEALPLPPALPPALPRVSHPPVTNGGG